MPVFLNGGNMNAVHQMSYGGLSQNTINFLQGQLNMIQNTPYLQGMYEAAKIQFEQLNGDHAQRVADAVIRASKSIFDVNVVRPLTTMEELQLATPTMQRWLMTSPFLRKEAEAGRINGWRDTRVNQEPGCYGEEQHDWKLLNNGMLQEVPGADWEMKQYFVEFEEGEKPLTLSQRLDCLDSIKFAEAFVRRLEEDPTSPYGDYL